ncbi:SCO1/SenC-domain-containing protein [Globomyces pollinis-pini]|nr:SCO1/SenC-domain-containing protein [Globomyces pollinis-pini]
MLSRLGQIQYSKISSRVNLASTWSQCRSVGKTNMPAIWCQRVGYASRPLLKNAAPKASPKAATRAAPKQDTTKEDFSRMSTKSIGLFILSGLGLASWFLYEKYQLQLEKESQKDKPESYGKPNIGGSFALVDHDGKPVSDLDFKGKYMLIYFGYTFCPDVCPEELEKMAEILDSLAKKGYGEDKIVPLFISCDPKRDSIASISEYVKEFHPRLIGLTGTHQQIKTMAKKFRMYYSAPPRAVDDDEQDYLVDHSIFFYLMDRDGQFLATYGRNDDAKQMEEKMLSVMSQSE